MHSDRASAAPSPHDTGFYPPRAYLFLDNLHVGRMDGLRRVAGAVEHVTDGPVLVSRLRPDAA